MPLPSPSLKSSSTKTSDLNKFSRDQPNLEGSTSNSAQFREDDIVEAGVPQEVHYPKMNSQEFWCGSGGESSYRIGMLALQSMLVLNHPPMKLQQLIRIGRRQWFKKWMLFWRMELGNSQSYRPLGKRALFTRWIFKAKDDIHGNLQRRKARLVVRWYEQREGIDYEETFLHPYNSNASGSRCSSQVATLSHGRHHNFLEWRVQGGRLHHSTSRIFWTRFWFSEHLVCKLKKALYGLKRTPKTWYNKIDSYLKEKGFCKGEGDYNLYVVKNKGNNVLLVLYVADLLFERSQVNWLVQIAARAKFEMSELENEDVTLYLRRSVCRWGRGSLCPNVAIHAISLSASTCLNVKLLQHPWWNGLGLNQTSEKRRLTQFSMKKLLENLSTWHMPIPTSRTVSESWAVSCQNLNSHIFKLAKEFSGTIHAPGIIGFSFEIMKFNPQYFRALWINDWGGEFSSGRITTSLVFRLGSSPVSWFSQETSLRFNVLLRSWIQVHRKYMQILAKDMDIEDIKPTTIFCDNQASIFMAKNIDHQHALEALCNSLLLLLTECWMWGCEATLHSNKISDIFTKTLGKPLFQKFRTGLNIMRISEVCRKSPLSWPLYFLFLATVIKRNSTQAYPKCTNIQCSWLTTAPTRGTRPSNFPAKRRIIVRQSTRKSVNLFEAREGVRIYVLRVYLSNRSPAGCRCQSGGTYK